jgi:hypothetical protein
MPARLKKIGLTVFLFLLIVFRASSPCMNGLIIFETAPVEPYSKLVYAIGFVETMNDTTAYNPFEQAAGIFQIRPIRLREYNIQTGMKYRMEDLFRYEISERIFLYFADQIGPYNFELIARNWNGSGQMTTFYWNRIKQYL